MRLKASKPFVSANSHELHNNRHFEEFAADTIQSKKPSVGPKGLIGPPCHGTPGRRGQSNFITIIIIIISVAGILYFGIRAISENSKKEGENPFEYNIEKFKKSEKNLIHYAEDQQIKINLQNMHGIAIGPEDKIYVSGDNSVLILNKDGSTHSSIKMSGPAFCLAVDENGDLYAGMREHVEVYDKAGNKKARWESLGENAIITSIAISKESIFIADAGNRIVWKYSKSGDKLARIGDKNQAKDIPGFVIPSPYFDVALDPDGFLWVVNPGRHSLENYTKEGNIRTSWGEYSMKVEGFCGCCNPTHITILDNGSFVTSEKGIARVKIYNRLGKLVSIVAAPDQFNEGTVGLDLAKDSSQRIYVLDPVRKAVRIFFASGGGGGGGGGKTPRA
ncbi:MAG: NHL repeat-containing protein, partial [Candidatus Aminicenantes bacterium]